jgi:hypothetical protein
MTDEMKIFIFNKKDLLGASLIFKKGDFKQ